MNDGANRCPNCPFRPFIFPFTFCWRSLCSDRTFYEREVGDLTLIGLVRVSTDKQKTQRQHDALAPICLKVFEEKISGKLAVDDRPGLTATLDYLRVGDMLCVQEVDRLGRNLLEGLIVLNDLFQRGIAVKVLEGIAVGEHTERSLILDLVGASPHWPGVMTKASGR
ncbi:recombinase family protein [Streptomyces sp. NPDC056653]|uniref:recombinase family protein n=1 Tax=Streptomyces sp. NPDC056653 TaxID=3345894 RepID=UPI00369A0E44